MDIRPEVSAWDGKSAAAIRAVFNWYVQDVFFIDELVALLAERQCQKGATWLLKACIEDDHTVSAQQSAIILEQIDVLACWESKLHVLQILPALKIDALHKLKLERFLRDALNAKNKFVRAWAYNGFIVLATQYPEYQPEAEKLIDNAMQDEAPSVKARIRQVMARCS
ncbi:hypothetical protein OLMES_2361 [Oleiphilus messinensis]|uniref:DNA alkylation repair enzyme n=1 Tax=Oleiphilus messinensis TaxID=141451 RepID=A0A1Y0IAH4_9GAMM|nr:hypothetical protein [Oleiphilus messinensis]ARU56424.1 hypothetical protein OLMES_2361 [Oleiphilus messinensis]